MKIHVRDDQNAFEDLVSALDRGPCLLDMSVCGIQSISWMRYTQNRRGSITRRRGPKIGHPHHAGEAVRYAISAQP